MAGGVDDSDVVITASLNDIRNTSDLTDYAGELQASVTLNITDKDPVNALPSTLAPLPFKVTIPCTPTASTTIGSTCGVSTSGRTPDTGDGSRGTASELGDQRGAVYDGGADGLASTAGQQRLRDAVLFVP